MSEMNEMNELEEFKAQIIETVDEEGKTVELELLDIVDVTIEQFVCVLINGI